MVLIAMPVLRTKTITLIIKKIVAAAIAIIATFVDVVCCLIVILLLFFDTYNLAEENTLSKAFISWFY